MISSSDPAHIFSGAPKHVQVLVDTGILTCDTQHVDDFELVLAASSETAKEVNVIENNTKRN